MISLAFPEKYILRWTPQNLINKNLSIKIGSGNGLVPSGTKPLPEPMLTKFYDTLWRHQGPMSSITEKQLKFNNSEKLKFSTRQFTCNTNNYYRHYITDITSRISTTHPIQGGL